MQPFSVLMSIYYKEKPAYFDRAMRSIWDEQSVKPNEIILVLDGPLTDELNHVINIWKEKLGRLFKPLPLKENVGLGNALDAGLKLCSHELVARMDTDDISLPTRFQKQLAIFENSNIDICSSWISEFDNNESHIISLRKVPENHLDIVKFSKNRNPLNHPAVMYKKSVVESVESYKKMLLFEDYYLWVRLIMKGAQFHNIQDPLVNMRAGYGQLNRRSGLRYALYEFDFQKKLYQIGFISSSEFIKNVVLRFTVRVLPKQLITMLYKKIRTLSERNK